MEKIRNEIQAVYTGKSVSSNGVTEIYYQEEFQQAGGQIKKTGFTAIVENKTLLETMTSLKVGETIKIETETTLSKTELKTVVKFLSKIMPVQAFTKRAATNSNYRTRTSKALTRFRSR